MQITHSHILLDACCVLNLCASGQFLAILKSLPAEVVVATVVQEYELKTLQRLTSKDNDTVLEFEEAITQSLLKVVDFESEEEEESFVNYAFDLDDGESATCAIAVHRKWAVATDDDKAIKFLQKNFPHIQILSTPEIIKHWSEQESIDS
jgi:predicted nucleic acid-binding protein